MGLLPSTLTGVVVCVRGPESLPPVLLSRPFCDLFIIQYHTCTAVRKNRYSSVPGGGGVTTRIVGKNKMRTKTLRGLLAVVEKTVPHLRSK